MPWFPAPLNIIAVAVALTALVGVRFAAARRPNTGPLGSAAGWLIAAAIMAVTIIGLPWAAAALRIAVYTFLPFGYTVADKPPGAFGGLFGAITLLGAFWLIVDMPTSFVKAFGLWTGVLSGAVLTYVCVLGSRRFK